MLVGPQIAPFTMHAWRIYRYTRTAHMFDRNRIPDLSNENLWRNDTRQGSIAIMKHAIDIQRVYEHTGDDGHVHFLVDRLWPRGVKKESLNLGLAQGRCTQQCASRLVWTRPPALGRIPPTLRTGAGCQSCQLASDTGCGKEKARDALLWCARHRA